MAERTKPEGTTGGAKAPMRVLSSEFVLRRVHKNQVDPGPPPAIAFIGFRPTPEDTTGLSVYRDKHVSASEVAAAGRKPGEYYVTRLAVEDVNALGLTVIIDEQVGKLAGHAVIPELSFDACQRDKMRLRAIQVKLAELANQAIVHFPDAS